MFLDELNERQRKLVSRRFGLQNKKAQTLAAIGRSEGVSRERVRQIVTGALLKLKKKIGEAEENEEKKEFYKMVLGRIEEEGGVIGRNVLLRETLSDKTTLSWAKRAGMISFILSSLPGLQYKKPSVRFGELWYLPSAKDFVAKVDHFHNDLIVYFEKQQKPYTFAKLQKEFGFYAKTYAEKEIKKLEIDKKKLGLLLRESCLLGENILGQWGLAKWKIIRPTAVREKAYLVFKKEREPLHFRALTTRINQHWKDRRRALPQTVHNAIIKYPEFVVVDLGTYGLKEWLYEENDIRQRLLDFFKENKKASIEELVNSLKKKKESRVRLEITLRAILHREKMFIRRNGKYMVK